MVPQISVLIPVYNEAEIIEQSLATLCAYLQPRFSSFEILVLDNGSADRTQEVVSSFAASHSEVAYHRTPERGAGRAFVHGVRVAKGERLLTLDADLSSDLAFIDYARDLLAYAEMVVGSKTMGNQRRTFLRVLGSQTYILFSQLLFDMTVSDYSIGCKAIRRSEILPALDYLDSWTGYIFELCLFLNLRGKKIVQIGIDCNDTRRSRFNLLHEGLYRFRHLYRCYRLLKSETSWLRASMGR